MYFERQGLNTQTCVLHALNNCLQQKKATALELDTIAHTLAVIEKAEFEHLCHRAGKKHFVPVSIYYRHLSKFGQNGGWSIRIARRFFLEHGIPHEWDIGDRDFSNGRYFLRTKIGDCMHAIAIVDGMLLDSVNSGPVKWTSDRRYTILIACRVLI